MSVKITTLGAWAKTAIAPLLFIAAATVATVVSYTAHAATPEEDFAARCAATGVLVCEGFDNASTFTYSSSKQEGLTAGDNTIGIQDTSTKASGASSLRFDIPGLTGSDPAGNFAKNFGQTFGQNSTFYVQWRQRFDDNMLNINWYQLMNTSFKQVVMYSLSGTPCANIELTTVNVYSTGIPEIYSECGNNSVRTSLSDFTHQTSEVPYYYQQGASLTSGYNCQYDKEFVGTGNGKGCYAYSANKWITFYERISVGTWGNPNSSIQAWVSVDGGPYLQWVNVRDYVLRSNGSSNDGWGRIMLTPYMTNKNSSVNHATAHTWYDELIISTQPITAPGGASQTAIAAPSNLRIVQ